MNLVSTPYERSGRTRQKARTRAHLIAAARTPAYRYFPSQKALLAAAHPETEASSLLPPGIGDDPQARLQAAVQAFTQLISETEQQQRTMLRLSLEPDLPPRELPLRKGRAIAWFEEALAP